MPAVEVAPGVTRIESVLGPRPFSQYLVRAERTLLVDTGVAGTPASVIHPALDGIEPDLVLLTHADVDHFGGTAAVLQKAPRALVLAHEADVPWIESSELILRERYGWYDDYGIGYDADTFSWLRDAIGSDTPVDIRLAGGEVLRLGPELELRVLHLPGHSPGHIGLWEPASRTAIVGDAVLGHGLLDTEGNVVHPPPIGDPAGYERSAHLLRDLAPERLLTAHYDVLEGHEVERFLEQSLAFVERAREVVASALAEDPEIAMKDLLAYADGELGPFTSMPNELGATLRGVLRESGREPRR